MEFVAGYEGRTVNDIRTRLEEVVENRGEGLIIKHPLSEYVLNGRNVDWVKVKPEYMVSVLWLHDNSIHLTYGEGGYE